MASFKSLYQVVINQLRIRITRVQFVMVIATLTGLVAGLVAVLLKTLVHYVQLGVRQIPVSRFSYLLFPGLGLLLTVFIIRHFFGKEIEKGIAMVLKSIARRSSFIPLKHVYLHVVTSSATVGLGGSAGLESPIVSTGAAIGSNLARITDLNYSERTLLIACGAAAGIAAVFNAPIAGVIFAVEVLMTETVVSYFIPLMISSVMGALCSKIILKEASLFNFVLKQNFNYNNVPYYIMIGILAGFVSLYYAKIFKAIEGRLHNSPTNAYTKALFGGLLLLVICFVFPPLFGEGYESVKLVANATPGHITDNTTLFSRLGENWGLITFTALIVLVKPIAAAVTIGAGGNGGNFAPSLFTGAYLGYFFSRLLNSTPWIKIPEGNFSLVGMAGVLSGVMYCPLTAIFLIAEITNGYELFIPLMIVSSISFFIVKTSEPFSMETKKLASLGHIFTHQKEKNILTSIRLSEMLESTYESISMDKKMMDLIELIKKSDKNIFAVHDGKDRFAGIIELNDVKQKLFQPDGFATISIKTLMKKPAAILREDQDMHSVMEQFDISHSWWLPVLDKDNIFIGFISKTKVFNKYREVLSQQKDFYEVG
ncbi:MAG TPA: chloride channel protein [Chitinophagaceae bacterium]|nr:chloride channel protein [Chitinophagaceae bacterium]